MLDANSFHGRRNIGGVDTKEIIVNAYHLLSIIPGGVKSSAWTNLQLYVAPAILVASHMGFHGPHPGSKSGGRRVFPAFLKI